MNSLKMEVKGDEQVSRISKADMNRLMMEVNVTITINGNMYINGRLATGRIGTLVPVYHISLLANEN